MGEEKKRKEKGTAVLDWSVDCESWSIERLWIDPNMNPSIIRRVNVRGQSCVAGGSALLPTCSCNLRSFAVAGSKHS